MFTYGYIREAVMAHLDIDEEEAQAMNLLSRFHIFANEAMQAICASKPKYQYVDVTVVDKFDPIVVVTNDDGSFYLRKATETEIYWDREANGDLVGIRFLTEEELKEYYHKLNIYQVYETVEMSDTFIAFANKQAYKMVIKKPTIEEQLEAEAFNREIPKEIQYLVKAEKEYDFSYISKNGIKFYKAGHYLIPAKYLWFRFDSGIGDEIELDMPADILLTIPLYIASICLRIDNLQKSQILRSEFEMALARCTATDMMKLNDIPSTY